MASHKIKSPVWKHYMNEWILIRHFLLSKIGSLMASHEKNLLCGTDYMNECTDLGSDSGTGSKYI